MPSARDLATAIQTQGVYSPNDEPGLYLHPAPGGRQGTITTEDVTALAKALLTADALMVALAEALDRLRVTAGRDLYDASCSYYHATQAIEAHVRRHRAQDEAAMRDDVALSLSGPRKERRWK